ncbi:TetR/AcrR family transcriptional regulator [Kineococcus rhizosphaerae]|uniref:TetR family transcriptional regulator n=1 Tax=Kineococcus rhizosphaerae TaxID=559628 RepID=A0A2T0QWN8_9ACTN|nr:TetR/AcrR family transcriptional regulator [Kineococcus rhizosphaerae]PRY09788.1 TetR family transcriptional regulator [Kineococcus rhizosphaerae]
MTTANAKTSMRDRLVEAASALFYTTGLRAVSVDKVIERAGTTKVTFYRHFKAKDDLVAAYLQASAQREREGVEAAFAAAGGDVRVALARLGELIGASACRPGFRGCAFINAAAEYPDADSAPRRVVDAHRAWYRSAFQDLVAPLGVPDPTAVAEDLLLLRDGAMVAGYLDDPAGLAASFARSSSAVVSAAR